jgi:hypothetical protein
MKRRAVEASLSSEEFSEVRIPGKPSQTVFPWPDLRENLCRSESITAST